MVDWVPTAAVIVAVGSLAFAGLTWLESRKQRALLETLTKSLPYVSRRRPRMKRKTKPVPTPMPATGLPPTAPPPVPAEGSGRLAATTTAVAIPSPTRAERLREQAEERRRLKLDLEREKEQWRRQKDIAKAIGWVLDRIGGDEEDDEDED